MGIFCRSLLSARIVKKIYPGSKREYQLKKRFNRWDRKSEWLNQIRQTHPENRGLYLELKLKRSPA